MTFEPFYLFAYGTLTFPEIMDALSSSGGSHCLGKASLPGYERRCEKSTLFPVMYAKDGATTDGTLWQINDSETGLILDCYEDAFYQLEWAEMMHNGKKISVKIYTVTPDSSHIGDAPWDPDAFKKAHIDDYQGVIADFKEVFALWQESHPDVDTDSFRESYWDE